MSLPPLVCNTPPPPDQCEDEKDPEDFDLNYNLSQDEEDNSNDYDYQTYTNYNIYETSKSEQIQENSWTLTNDHNFVSPKTENLDDDKHYNDHIPPIINDLDEKLTFEDTTIEDLNLEINGEISKNINTEKCEVDSCENDIVAKETAIVSVENAPVNSENTLITQSVNNCLPYLLQDSSQEINVTTGNSQSQSLRQEFECDLKVINKDTAALDQPDIETDFKNEAENLENYVQCDNDFGDFDDFQFVNTNNNVTTVVENFENPWNNENTQSSDFGQFKANFDENSEYISHIVTSPNLESAENEMYLKMPTEGNDDQDDFGDFDDFKSCSEQFKEEDQSINQQVAVLDFHSPESESQILESINSIFNSIFEQEITEPDYEYTAKLESGLNETWGHLVDMDVRQPYIVHWNNSLGQKSLLKALCIDSRNILFGPKWTYNMPKYAVNLSTAPLQPQKPLTSALSNSETLNPDKSMVKETGTWIDPFSSNGQDSSSNENENTKEKLPTDLEIFDKVKLKKSDKIYHAPLNVQPLRQINLPDTHIFTPSDSETPRSKKIHYDSSPPVIAPSLVTDEQTAEIECTQSSVIEPTNKVQEDNDYWEFQDYKSSSEPVKLPSNEQDFTKPDTETTKYDEIADVPYQPHLLQPMKVEPIMPTLNWPEPGEVKETFDDFSDFISSTSWDSNKKNETTADIHVNHEKKTLELDAHNNILNKETTFVVQNNDDDFETFQSAPPVSQNVVIKSLESCIDLTTCQPSTSKAENNVNREETKDIFVTNFVPENHNTNVTSFRDGFMTNSPVRSMETPSLLQPLPANSSGANSSRNQNNTGQILQPLSLESYSQINWPNPGIDLQDLSRFNPVETLPSLKSDFSNSQSKVNSPVHNEKSVRHELVEDDIWGEFVSSNPRQQIPAPKKLPIFGDEDEWTEFVSSPSVKPPNGLNTISLNVHTNLNLQKSNNFSKINTKNNDISVDIPTLNYITPKSHHKTYNDKHFQNL